MIRKDVLVPAAGAVLAGTLALPSQGEPVALSILLPGSGHHDRDETVGKLKPFAVIADHLAASGIGSLCLDGRGIGLSGGSADNVDFRSKVDDVLAARHWLLEATGVVADRLVFIGHSEGGLVGAAAAATRPTALAMLSGPCEPIVAILHSLAEMQSSLAGATPSQIVHERAMNEAAFALASVPGEPQRGRLVNLIDSYLVSWPDTEGPLPDTDRLAAAEAMADILLAADYRSLLQQHPEDYLRQLTRPVLAIFGERDCQVLPQPNLAAFHAATAGQKSANAVVLPDHNHMFQVAITGQIDEYQSLGKSPSPVALKTLSDWIFSALDIRNSS